MHAGQNVSRLPASLRSPRASRATPVCLCTTVSWRSGLIVPRSVCVSKLDGQPGGLYIYIYIEREREIHVMPRCLCVSKLTVNHLAYNL